MQPKLPNKQKGWVAPDKGARPPVKTMPVMIRKIKPKTTRTDVVAPARMG